MPTPLSPEVKQLIDRPNFAHLATRGADQVDIHATRGIQRQCATHTKGFVVRVGQDG